MNGKPGKRLSRILKRIVLVLVVLAILGGGAAYAYAQLKSEYTITYDSYTATIGSISNSLSFSGSFQLVNSTNYTASADCKLRDLYVSAGDSVAEGDKLARLSTGETLTADFDGVINTLSADEGDELAAGATIMQLVDFEHMKVTLRIDEYDIASVSVGTRCTVTATATEQTYESEIAAIDYVSASTGSVAYYTATTYVDVGEGIYPGMQVTVTIPEEEANDVVVLKVDALSFDANNQAYVYMLDDSGEMTPVNVEVGVSNGNYCQIISGVADGDTVYVVAQTDDDASSGLAGLLSGLFNQGGPNISGRGGNMGGFDRSNMPDLAGGDMSGFDRSNMPDFAGGNMGGMGGGNG